MSVLVALLCLALLAACISVPTAYTHADPGGVWPAGELSGAPTYFVGWRVKF